MVAGVMWMQANLVLMKQTYQLATETIGIILGSRMVDIIQETREKLWVSPRCETAKQRMSRTTECLTQLVGHDSKYVVVMW